MATTDLLHNDIYNEDFQGKVNMLRDFSPAVHKKNTNSVISYLRCRNEEVSTKKKDLEDICFEFNNSPLKGQEFSEEAIA